MFYGLMFGAVVLVVFFLLCGVLYRPYASQSPIDEKGVYLSIAQGVFPFCPTLKFMIKFADIRASYINKYIIFALCLIVSIKIRMSFVLYAAFFIHSILLLITIWTYGQKKKIFHRFISECSNETIDITKKSFAPAMKAFLTLPIYQTFLQIILFLTVFADAVVR